MQPKRKRSIPSDVRAEADLTDVLDRLGIEVVKDDGRELLARCRSGKHPDEDPSWSIRHEGERAGMFYCFSCSWGGDVFDLVMKIRGCDFPDALEFVRESGTKRLVDGDDVSEGTLFDSYEPPIIHQLQGLFPIFPDSECAAYLEGREIGSKEISDYGLRDWRAGRRVWVPLTRASRLVSWLARRYDGGRLLKVLTPTGGGIGKKWGIFGLDRVDKSVKEITLLEGWVSAIRVVQAGFKNVVATCGCSLSVEQVEELSWAEKVTHWKEHDVGGDALADDVRQWFGSRELITVPMPDKRDPAEYSPDELVKLYETRRQ